jgi:hypothetical protein
LTRSLPKPSASLTKTSACSSGTFCRAMPSLMQTPLRTWAWPSWWIRNASAAALTRPLARSPTFTASYADCFGGWASPSLGRSMCLASTTPRACAPTAMDSAANWMWTWTSFWISPSLWMKGLSYFQSMRSIVGAGVI